MTIDDLLNKFKDYKDIADIIKEKDELSFYYNCKDYQKFNNFIQMLMNKYYLETKIWNNRPNSVMPITVEDSYINAINFLNTKAAELLVEKGIKISKEPLGEN